MKDDVKPDTATATSLRWFRANLWLHRWTSLIATIPFLILCLTGTVLIFHDEIDEAMGWLPTAPGLSDGDNQYSKAIANTLAAYPDEKVIITGVEPDDHPGLLLVGTVPNGDTNFDNLTRRFAVLSTGELTQEEKSEGKTLTGFLFELHAEWFLGPAGAILGSLIALLVLASLLSGLVVYGPHIRRTVFGTFRRGRGARLYQLDLHNYIGVIVVGWLFVVTLTGLFLGVGSIVTGVWAQGQLKGYQEVDESIAVDVRQPPVDIGEAVKSALSEAPSGWSLQAVIWPGTNFTTDRYYAVRIVGSGINERVFRVVLVDAVTGNVSRTVELPWFMKTIVISQPLHFGDYGGMPLKLLWTACAWLALFITGNGAWLWWARRGKLHIARREVAA